MAWLLNFRKPYHLENIWIDFKVITTFQMVKWYYEVKICRGKWKDSSHWNQTHAPHLAWVASTLPLSYDNQTTTLALNFSPSIYVWPHSISCTPSHPSTVDEVWNWLKHVLRSGWLYNKILHSGNYVSRHACFHVRGLVVWNDCYYQVHRQFFLHIKLLTNKLL